MLGIFGAPLRDKEWPAALKSVERQHFCPEDQKASAHLDQPLKSDHFHQSAPHIYALAMDALELREGLSMLNVGSGSGYFSALVAAVTGVTGINHGIEVHEDMVLFAREKTSDLLAEFQFMHGSVFALDIDNPRMRYDRVYVGAGAEISHKAFLCRLLRPNGILVGPFESEMLKVRKDANGQIISEEVIAHVRFAPLLEPPLPATRLSFDPQPPGWSPVKHSKALPCFRTGIHSVLCTSLRLRWKEFRSPPGNGRRGPISIGRLPKELLLLIFSFMHRHWFLKTPSETEVLRKRLEDETKARQLAERKVTELQDEIQGLRLQLFILHRAHQRSELERETNNHHNSNNSNNGATAPTAPGSSSGSSVGSHNDTFGEDDEDEDEEVGDDEAGNAAMVGLMLMMDGQHRTRTRHHSQGGGRKQDQQEEDGDDEMASSDSEAENDESKVMPLDGQV